MKSCPSSLRKMRGRDGRDRLRVGDGDGVSFMVCGDFGLRSFGFIGEYFVNTHSKFVNKMIRLSVT